MQRLRRLAPLVGVPLLLSAATVPAHAATPGGQQAQTAVAITLITGDRVDVTPRPGGPALVTFAPGPDSRSDAAVTTYSAGHTYVVPSAASADVATGRLDRTLFDVTTLIAEQRDDAHSKTVPLIIRYAGTPPAALTRAKAAKAPGATATRVLSSIGAKAAAIGKTRTTDFWRSITPGKGERVASTIQRVSLDRKVHIALDQSVPQIGAPAAWQRGLTGKGVKVAVLDTGIDPNHPDFAGRIAASQNFTTADDAVDHIGHGTHVASITAGDGAASGGKYKGVAPEATLLNGKVLDDFGNGDDSGVIAGMEWAVAQDASVINLSLGGNDPSDGTDDLSQAVNQLSRSTGVLIVIAAGNCPAPHPSTVTSPAAADDALAVGNMLRTGEMNPGSCRGPRLGDGALKPEISAPGTGIVAARAAGTDLGQPVDDNYTTLSGTSMATPHVSGTAALVVQAHPTWKAAQLKARLISTADPQPGSRVDEQGAGRVDADQATDNSTTVDTGELELGMLPWPHPANDPVTRELTYTNPGTTPVALKLSASIDPAAATPKLSTDQLVVPAGGEAKVSVTVDRAAAGTGNFSGRILATAADADPIVTTFGWYAEKEQYYVTVNGIAHDGTPAEGPVTISRLDGEPVDLPGGATLENGSAKVRLVPGEYQASAVLMTDATDKAAQRFDLAVSPELTVTKDSTVTIDARPSRPVTVAAEGQPGLTAREQSMGYTVKNTAGVVTGASGISTSGAIRIFAATPTAKVTTGTSEFSSHARLEVPPYRAQVIGGESFTALDFYFGPSFTGVKNLPVFDAGHATADELKGAKGKLALIICGDLDTNGQLVKAAEDAGAAAALLYNPDAPGDGGVNGYWALGDNGEAKIPAMRISRAVAAHLKTKPVTVRVTGQAATPVIYDLVTPWQNQVPAKPQVLAKPAQLARVDELFGSHQAGMPISETRNAVTPGGSSYGGWMPPVFTTPARRTSYLLGNGTNWNSSLVLASGTGASMMTGSTTRTYRAGERLAGEWTRPVENSGLPATQDPAVLGVRRNGIGMSVEVSPFRHGPEEIGAADFGNSQLAVDRNGEEVASAPASGLWAVLPNDAADFKLTFDTGRESEFWKYSTAVHSVWSFRSQGGDGEVMPLVLADLDVPGADDLNQVKTGTPATLTLGLRHQAGSASTARFTAAELELSYDGTHWTTLPLTKVAEGKYKAIVTHPASQAGTAPSLRLTATDSAGSKLEQQVTKAYGLK